MKLIKFLIAGFFITISISSFSQEGVIEINNTSIDMPDIYSFGEITETAYTKYVIKNNRNSAVNVSEVNTPAGFFANISDMNIASGKKVILYVGVEPKLIEKSGDFDENIVIKTNLVMDIVINLKGTITKSTD
ncbi:MAG: hypothetical protein JXL97_10025 [Bacteroidales bacterium]|nr:hypothetical protein [Bacteroidales bacterium]